MPLQVPVVPQVDADDVAHSLSGSLPFDTAPQTPSTPEPFLTALQAEHKPAHAVLQHTPSTQLPVMHWEFAVQVWPLPWSGWHALFDIPQK